MRRIYFQDLKQDIQSDIMEELMEAVRNDDDMMNEIYGSQETELSDLEIDEAVETMAEDLLNRNWDCKYEDLI